VSIGVLGADSKNYPFNQLEGSSDRLLLHQDRVLGITKDAFAKDMVEKMYDKWIWCGWQAQ
jgi:hypothetical protein